MPQNFRRQELAKPKQNLTQLGVTTVLKSTLLQESSKTNQQSYHLLLRLTTEYIPVNPFISSHEQLERNTWYKVQCFIANTLLLFGI